MPVRFKGEVPRLSIVNVMSALDCVTMILPKLYEPVPLGMLVVFCRTLISGVTPVPVMEKLYGFSSRSSLPMDMIAVFAPELVGANVMVNVVLAAGAIDDEPG